MINLKTVRWLAAAFSIICVVQACTGRSGSQQQQDLAADTLKANALIKTGTRIQSGKSDSLLTLSNELYKIGYRHNYKKALLYAKIYDANYKWLKANHEAALKVAEQALADAEELGTTKLLPDIHGIISNLYKESGNYDLAFTEIDKAIKAARANHDTAEIISALGNKAMFTHSYYNYTDQQENDHSSLQLEFDALKMAEASNKYERMRIRFYNNIAQTYKEHKDYEKAIFYAGKAVVLATKYNQRRSLTYSYNWIGESYFGMGQRDKGFDYIYKALAITHDLIEPYRRMELYEVLNQLYEKTGDYKQSLAAYKRYDTLRDSMAVDKNTRRLNEMQVVYETAKKDKKIADLNAANGTSRRMARIIGVVAFLFLIMLATLFWQYLTIRKKTKIINGKNEGLNNTLLNIAFIQSHEVRKPLTNILGLMNLIKAENYKAEKQVLKMLEKTAYELDEKVRQVVKEAEGN
ncbi:hypothetical protein FPZ43_00945 [Mucilaginibacter pallidiroseus]|uniref:Histidine kinase n=1 Tax=Mucilaginibacter pallidiroseus TaxID=2599295 RepID=A0A563UIB4_9SPHI|nr:hypothetical protein [Mucilaginibacter pallidiroseus]TWR31081.1 hypothetical protein FPZ43_00945 [Mucilaginibacter pallidiroseus]